MDLRKRIDSLERRYARQATPLERIISALTLVVEAKTDEEKAAALDALEIADPDRLVPMVSQRLEASRLHHEENQVLIKKWLER